MSEHISSAARGREKTVTLATVFLLILASLGPSSAWAQSCPDRPPVLRLLPPPAPDVIMHTVTATDIERLSGTPPPHALMAMGYALDSRISIVRMGGACPAAHVVVSFGILRREVFLAREAAAVPCIRTALLAHEATHSRIVAEAARTFIERRRARLKALLAASYPMSNAPDALYPLLRQFADDFGTQMRGPLRRTGDNPAALAALAAACHGALGQMDRIIRGRSADL